MQRKSDPARIESVDRALLLLQMLAEQGYVSVSEAAAHLDVAPSTAHRLLATMVHRGFAVHGASRTYLAGPELTWAAGSPSHNHLIRLLRPHLEQLYELTGETVHAVVPVGADVRLIDGLESDQPLRVGLHVGVRWPGYCASGGKAMFSDMEWRDVEALHPDGLRPWPTAKIHTLEGLRRELAVTRRRGYSLNSNETEAGVTSMGVSLLQADGRPLVALTIVTPTARFNKSQRARFAEALATVRVAAERDVQRLPMSDSPNAAEQAGIRG